MAQFYTLEEAARVLGMSPDELTEKAQQRDIRAFLDGGTWRFRVVDVDELARRRGLGSDAELRLSDLEVPAVSSGADLEDLDLSEFQLGVARPDLGAETMHFAIPGDKPTAESGSDHDLMFDDLSLPPNPVTGSSSVIIGMQSSGKRPSDSDVRLVPEQFKGASDSDVRLASPDPDRRLLSDSDVTLIKDDTSEHNFLTSGSGDTAVRPSPVVGSSAEVPAGSADDSDFELNPSSDLVDVLSPESGSDFELSALDQSDEFEATPMRPSDSDVTAADPNLSGINLSRPSDSGINLQGVGNFNLGADSIELAPLSGDEVPTSKSKPAPKAAPGKAKPSLAATPPPVIGKGEKDIFDDTDFEVDAALDDESDDRTMQLPTGGSDFDIEDSDSGSEVFAIDEEDVDQNAATAMAPSAFADDDDDEDDDGFDDAVSSEMATSWSSDDSPSGASSTPAMVISREAAVDWDGLSVGLLAAASLFIFFAAFIAQDLVRNLYDFNEGGVASGLVRSISGMLFS
ncbi:MAG: helix-turn-helix domain-containing protein [Paludisphaera borealis]|uniref:helix-turn-helix domain-containing protein n=1 Tax=Paludisphaera borealis TaxID=1387353 RepID=UPI002841759D|nr:helix-turn-helix domain-containing protein [Paludisphaera borealis]MDR3620362.1 helix-turn-helix domain-containing protein [Paludisphaera borealis]